MPTLCHPVVDGLFYLAAPAALRAQVADYLAAVVAGANDAERCTPPDEGRCWTNRRVSSYLSPRS